MMSFGAFASRSGDLKSPFYWVGGCKPPLLEKTTANDAGEAWRGFGRLVGCQ